MVTIITLTTKFNCTVPLSVPSVDGAMRVVCGADVDIGSTIMYDYDAQRGCSYSVYDVNNTCIAECVLNAESSSACGGGFTIDDAMSYIVFRGITGLHRVVCVTVADLISGVSSIDILYDRLEYYHIDSQHTRGIVDVYLDNKSLSSLEVYPVGAIYLSSTYVDPATLFGGVWEAVIGVFPDTIYAWTRIVDGTMPIVDIAIADLAICA